MLDDNNYTPIGKDTNPIIQEISYDYDDMKGVVNDTNLGFESTSYTLTEILGGKCTICNIRNTVLLKIHSIRNVDDDPKFIRHLVKKMIKNEKDPRKDFCVLCYNCDILMNKIKKYRKSTGLRDLTRNELEQELRVEIH
ncbi:MAG: hypothetical protein COA77_01385 [Thaumarchaeota archaeon]|nr:MAG: hypothetical protein COA77_01385 [Nitrososphaerota archaeon]